MYFCSGVLSASNECSVQNERVMEIGIRYSVLKIGTAGRHLMTNHANHHTSQEIK